LAASADNGEGGDEIEEEKGLFVVGMGEASVSTEDASRDGVRAFESPPSSPVPDGRLDDAGVPRFQFCLTTLNASGNLLESSSKCRWSRIACVLHLGVCNSIIFKAKLADVWRNKFHKTKQNIPEQEQLPAISSQYHEVHDSSRSILAFVYLKKWREAPHRILPGGENSSSLLSLPHSAPRDGIWN
jgi:hypothetical protein